MSHFAVLVATKTNPADDPAELAALLQPYHEYECTGVKDQYVVQQDITADVRNDWLAIGNGKTFAEYLDLNEYTYETDATGEVVKVTRWTNPNDKWDWWEVGGRYSNRLVSLAGDTADSLRRDDIDFSAMLKRNRQRDPAAPALSCFAYIDANGWREKGQMGWYAVVSDMRGDGDWQDEVNRWVDSVPGDHYVTVVNCHT